MCIKMFTMLHCNFVTDHDEAVPDVENWRANTLLDTLTKINLRPPQLLI